MGLQNIMTSKTFVLGGLPSFLSGVASAIDLGNTYTQYNQSKDGREADYKALVADWEAVGDDMIEAMDEFEKEQAR